MGVYRELKEDLEKELSQIAGLPEVKRSADRAVPGQIKGKPLQPGNPGRL